MLSETKFVWQQFCAFYVKNLKKKGKKLVEIFKIVHVLVYPLSLIQQIIVSIFKKIKGF